MTDLSPLFISLKTSVTATALAGVLGVAAAWGVYRLTGLKRSVIDGLCTLPLVLPPTVLGFFLLVIFGKNSPIGQTLLAIGIRIVFSWEATVIAATIVAFPLVYRTTRSAFEQVDRTITDAARTLGLRETAIFFKVLIPLAWPGILGGTILGFARALGEFGATLMIAGNIPGRTQTIPVAIYFAAEGGKMNTALQWVLIIVSISFSAIFLMNLTERKRI